MKTTKCPRCFSGQTDHVVSQKETRWESLEKAIFSGRLTRLRIDRCPLVFRNVPFKCLFSFSLVVKGLLALNHPEGVNTHTWR